MSQQQKEESSAVWASRYHSTHRIHGYGLNVAHAANMLYSPLADSSNERQYEKIDAENAKRGIGPIKRPDPLPPNNIRENYEATRSQKRRENLENFLATKKNGDSEDMKTAKATKTKTATATKKAARESSTVRRRVERVTPRAGSKFVTKFKGKEYTMTVEKSGDGVVYKVGGKTFENPNKAQAHVVGRPSAHHGWQFWGIDGDK